MSGNLNYKYFISVKCNVLCRNYSVFDVGDFIGGRCQYMFAQISEVCNDIRFCKMFKIHY